MKESNKKRRNKTWRSRLAAVLLVIQCLIPSLPQHQKVVIAATPLGTSTADAHLHDQTRISISSTTKGQYLTTEGGILLDQSSNSTEVELTQYESQAASTLKAGGKSLRGYRAKMPMVDTLVQKQPTVNTWGRKNKEVNTYSVVNGSNILKWKIPVPEDTGTNKCQYVTQESDDVQADTKYTKTWAQQYTGVSCTIETAGPVIHKSGNATAPCTGYCAIEWAYQEKQWLGTNYDTLAKECAEGTKEKKESAMEWIHCNEPLTGWAVGDLYAYVPRVNYVGSGSSATAYGSVTKEQVTSVSNCTDYTAETYCTASEQTPKAAIRPVYTVDPNSILFVSESTNTVQSTNSTLNTKTSRFVTTTEPSNTDGYKLYLKDSAMQLNGVTETSDATKVQSKSGNNITIMPGTTKLSLQTSSAGTGVSAPTHLAAAATATQKKGGTEMFGELATMSPGSTVNAELDLTNLMDVYTPGESVSIDLYAEQENGEKTTSYMSEPYTINVTVVADQVLTLTNGQTLSGEYGDKLTLTAGVNETVEAPNRKWDAENALTASIADGYEDIADVDSTWDGTTGKTTIVITPKKSGTITLKLHKDENKEKGFYVGTNDVITDEITIETRKVKLTPKAQEHTKLELYQDFEIVSERASPGKEGAGIVTGDSLPESIKVKVDKTDDGQIPTRTVSDIKRLSTVGTWNQTVNLDEYNSNKTLADKYDFTVGDSSVYEVKEALTPADAHIVVSPDCTYNGDSKCWRNKDVTIAPSSDATTGGYSQIKNTTAEDDQIEKNEEGFGDSITITEEKTDLNDIKYNLKDPTKNALTNQGLVKDIRIDKTAPETIDVKVTNTPVVAALEESLKAIVEAAGGNTSGIRFDKVPLQVEITATDSASGIREVKAYKVDDSGNSSDLSLVEEETSREENASVEGPGKTVGDKTYSKRVYKVTVRDNYKGKIKVVATDNAGNESEKTTNMLAHEAETETSNMILTAGDAAQALDADTYKITSTQLSGADEIKWPLKFQAPHSGIKKISYYITDENGNALKGTEADPIDVTNDANIKVLDENLGWDNADDNKLDTNVHDDSIVNLRDAINLVKDEDKAIVKVHVKLESNAGNTKEETFTIQALYQKIDWSQSVKENKTSTDSNVLELEVTYGTPITLSAEMVGNANHWSQEGDFSFSVETADNDKVKLRNLQHSNLTTTNNPSGTAKGKATVELVPLVGDDTVVTITAKKAGDNDFMDSNTITLKVKLKSKPITVTAKPNTTYNLRTGELHPKLEYTITDAANKINDEALIKDADAGIDDTAAENKVDFLLKATSCVDGTACGINDLSNYTQDTDRINVTGEWKLEFQYNKEEKSGNTKEAVFNRRYDITFIDYMTADNPEEKTLKVTQDSFTNDWYTITPEPDNEVKSDKHAWNTSTVTIEPTDKAVTKDTVERKYSTINNDDIENAETDQNQPDTWDWKDSFTHDKDYTHDAEKATDPKTYKLRFRDPTTGAFTATADAKRSVRVDETAPIKPFIGVNNDMTPDDSAIADTGTVQGTRFSKNGFNITVSMIDEESGMRSLKIYTVDKDDNATLVSDAKISDTDSTVVPGVTDGSMAVRKKTGTFTISSEFKGKIRIVGMNNAGQSTTLESNQIINEPETTNKLEIEMDNPLGNEIPDEITRANYDKTYIYPWKINAPISGIKQIKYTMQVDDNEETVNTLLKKDGDITSALSVETIEDKAVDNNTTAKTPTYTVDKNSSNYGTYFKIKDYVDKMIEKNVELGTIKIKIELESNAGNTLTETFELRVDLMLNDAQSYLVVPKQVRLQRVKGQDIAQGIDEVKLKTITEDEKPAGLDITQYFNVYTNPTITLDKVNDESGRKHTFKVSVRDKDGNTLTEQKNLLASLSYPTNTTSKFTLITPLEKDPEKDKDGGEYRGTMKYEVKYGKQDTEKKPTAEVKP